MRTAVVIDDTLLAEARRLDLLPLGVGNVAAPGEGVVDGGAE